MLKMHLGLPSPTIEGIRMPEWARYAEAAEQLGFECLWHSNERFFREMFVRMTVTSMVTSHIEIGGAVVEPYAQHPVLTAQSLATVGELSGGRATVAMAAGGSGFPMMGVERRRPAMAIREGYSILRALLAGETVTFDGEIVQAHRARLHFEPPPHPPLWIASRGDRVLEVGGAVADGTMIATYARPHDIRMARELVERGASKAGRQPDEVRIMARVDTCVDSDPRRAYEGSRLMIAKLLWMSYPDRNFVNRIGLDVPSDLEDVIAKRDYDLLPSVAEKVPDAFVEAMCWAGSPDMVADRVVEAHRQAGIREFGFWLLCAPEQPLEDAMDLVARAVIPAVRDKL